MVDLEVWITFSTMQVCDDIYPVLDVQLCRLIVPSRQKREEIVSVLYGSDGT